MTLAEYLSSLTGQRRQPGIHDCCTFPADWAVAQGWPDPMAQWRSTYGTEAEAETLIYDAGGLYSLFETGLSLAGIPLTFDDPAEGDIGVIIIGDDQAGAIFTGRRWAFVPSRGLGFASVDPAFIAARWRP